MGGNNGRASQRLQRQNHDSLEAGNGPCIPRMRQSVASHETEITDPVDTEE